MVGRPHMRLRNIAVSFAVCGAMLAAAPSAFAVSAAQSGYSFPAGSVQEQLGQSSNSTAAEPARQESESSSGSAATPVAAENNSKLPFTGLDIGLVIGAGAVLLAMGVGIRRLSRTPTA